MKAQSNLLLVKTIAFAITLVALLVLASIGVRRSTARESTNNPAPAAVLPASFVHAKGVVRFKDSDGNVKPFANVQVRLMDSDSDYDEEIARGFTDRFGRYDLSGSAGDSGCINCAKPDPYVKVVLEEPGRVEVHDIMHFTRNGVLTPIKEETAGEIDFGARTFTTEYPEGMAAILYERAQDVYDHFTAFSGDAKVPGNGGEVAIEIPVVISFGTPYTTWDTIHWPGVDTDFGGFDHEFGHRLRHTADGGVVHFNNDATWYRYARHHKLDEDTNLGFAFNEGWANYFRHVMQPGFLDDPWNGQFKGNEVEGHVAVKLINLSKNCASNSFNHGFFEMWKALKANPGEIHSFPEFYDAFLATKPPCKLDIPIHTKVTPRPDRGPLPPIDAIKLAGFRAQLKKQIDNLDSRSSRFSIPIAPRIPVTIPAQLHPVVKRLWQKRIESAKASDTRARGAYRRLLIALQPMSPRAVYDGSYARDARAARRAFVLALAQPRLREAQAIRRDIAAQKVKTSDATLLSYLTAIDAKYSRLEEKLKRAIQDSGRDDAKLPLEILPHSFSGAIDSQ
jgi:hypothetical protein